MDRNRKEGDESDKSDAMIRGNHYWGRGIDSRRIPVNSDANWFWIKNAKPGYVLIAEYFRKDKKLKLHMEKVQ